METQKQKNHIQQCNRRKQKKEPRGAPVPQKLPKQDRNEELERAKDSAQARFLTKGRDAQNTGLL